MKFNLNLLTYFVAIIVMSGCGDSLGKDPIRLVKNSTLEYDNTITVGELFESYPYLSSIEWTTFQNYQKNTFVILTGIVDEEIIGKYMTFQDQKLGIKEIINLNNVVLKVQFAVNQDEITSQLTYMGYEGFNNNGEKCYESGGSIDKISEIYKKEMSHNILEWCVGPISLVRKMAFGSDQPGTIGDVFDNYKYFIDVEWSSRINDDKKTIVTMIGTYNENIEKYYMGRLFIPSKAFLNVNFEINKKDRAVRLRKANLIGYMEDGTKLKGIIPMKWNLKPGPQDIIHPIYSNEVFDDEMLESIMWSP